jgi:hypothetical protein
MISNLRLFQNTGSQLLNVRLHLAVKRWSRELRVAEQTIDDRRIAPEPLVDFIDRDQSVNGIKLRCTPSRAHEEQRSESSKVLAIRWRQWEAISNTLDHGRSAAFYEGEEPLKIR